MAKKKVESRQCCIDGTVSCKCESDDKCIEVLKRYAKVVYCNDDKCLFNVALPYEYFVNRGKNHKPFKDDSFHGVCGRVDIGLRFKTSGGRGIEDKVTDRNAICTVRSDKGYKGHMDFSKLLQSDGTPYGGVIPDPVTPDAAFHV